LVASLSLRPDQDRLQDALVADRGGQLLELLLGKHPAGLVRIPIQELDGDRAHGRAVRLLRRWGLRLTHVLFAEQRRQSAAEASAVFRHDGPSPYAAWARRSRSRATTSRASFR